MSEITHQKQGSALKDLLKTSLPAVIDLAIQPVMWAYEAILIGRLGAGAAAIGGHGLAVQLIILTFTVLLTFVVGSSLIINRHLGSGNKWEANHILGQSLMLGFFISLFIAALFYFGGPQMFKIIKETEPEARSYGVQYLRTLAYFMPFIITNFIAVGIIRGSGDTHFSMLINLIVNGINLVLAPLLIFGTLILPRLEVTGAALAAGIAHTIGLIITIILLRTRRCRLFLSFTELTTPKWESIKLLFKKGLPTTIEQLVWSLGQLMISIWVARLGVIALALHQILMRIQAILSMVYHGFGLSSMTLVGKNVGAQNHRLAERTGLIAGVVMFFLALVVLLIFNTFSRGILRIFTNDQEIFSLGLTVIKIFALVQVPRALNTVLTGNLRGADELQWLMWIMIAGVLIFEISSTAGVIFLLHLGLNSVWVVSGIDEVVRFVLNYFRFKSGKWKLKTASYTP